MHLYENTLLRNMAVDPGFLAAQRPNMHTINVIFMENLQRLSELSCDRKERRKDQ